MLGLGIGWSLRFQTEINFPFVGLFFCWVMIVLGSISNVDDHGKVEQSVSRISVFFSFPFGYFCLCWALELYYNHHGLGLEGSPRIIKFQPSATGRATSL